MNTACVFLFFLHLCITQIPKQISQKILENSSSEQLNGNYQRKLGKKEYQENNFQNKLKKSIFERERESVCVRARVRTRFDERKEVYTESIAKSI